MAIIAARQLGLITRKQSEEAGATKAMIEHRLRSLRWQPVHRGVFRVNGAPRSFEQEALAACLAAGEGAVVSHLSATAIWGLTERPKSPIEVSVPAPRRCRARGFTVHHVKLSSKDVTIRGVIPITSPFRSLVDLAGVVKKTVIFECAFDDALRKGLLSVPKLIRQLEDLEGSTVPGIALFRRTFESRIGSGIPMSELETYFVNLLNRYGLPQPLRQHRITHDANLLGIVDFLYPDKKIVIECDGRAFHSIPSDFERDIHRGNDLLVAGWGALHFSWRDVLWRGRMVCKTIAQALGGGLTLKL